LYLMYCGAKNECSDLLPGIKWAVDAIDRRLTDIESETERCGECDSCLAGYGAEYCTKGGVA